MRTLQLKITECISYFLKPLMIIFSDIPKKGSTNSRAKRASGMKKTNPSVAGDLPEQGTCSENSQQEEIHHSRFVETTRIKPAYKITQTAEHNENVDLCTIWEARLKSVPGFDGNHDTISGLMQQRQYFLQAKALMAEFGNTNFQFRICRSLESIARDLQTRIIIFPSNFHKSLNRIASARNWSCEDRIEYLISDSDRSLFLGQSKEGVL